MSGFRQIDRCREELLRSGGLMCQHSCVLKEKALRSEKFAMRPEFMSQHGEGT